MHWFNPLAWLAVRRVEEAAECAADRWALRTNPQRAGDLARALLQLAQQGEPPRLFASAAGGRSLAHRLKQLVLDTETTGEETMLKRVTLVLVLACVALAAAVIPNESARAIAQLYQVGLGPDGFFKEAHVKLRPVEFGTDGVFLCGMAHYPKHLQESINQAYGAAGRAVALLSNDTVVASGSVCEVDSDACVACGTTSSWT